MSRRTLVLVLYGVAIVAGLAFITISGLSFVRGIRGGPNGSTGGAIEEEWPSTPRVRVEVLNGAGQPGIARLATEALRESGFDVVYYGNASEFGRDSSVVLDRLGRIEVAQEVASALGIRGVRSSPDSTLLLDVTVLLGRDWPVDQP